MRLAGQVKMGYYPTPTRVVELIRSMILFEDRKANVLDPCSGEGLALEALTRETKTETYGIELDGERAKAAKKRLDHLVHAGYEQVEISPQGFGLLFLNPPYDDGEGERKEVTFLRDMIDTLIPEGILVYIIPQGRLSRTAGAILSSNFTQIRVYRFPDPEFEAFKQIVVLGRKTRWPVDNARELARLEGLPNTDLPPLPENLEWPPYGLPRTENAIVRARGAKPEELVRMAQTSPLFTRLRDLTLPATLGRMGQPPTRLHFGHLGLLLAAGRLNGLVGKGADRHIVVGKPEKHIIRSSETEEDAKGNTIQIDKRLETFKVTIKMLLPSGVVKRLN